MEETPAAKYVEDHCSRKPGATSGFPFGEEHRVFKVRGKIFAVLHAEESPTRVTFRAYPELTGLLRGQYPSVRPARPFDKRYWSTLTCDGPVPTDKVVELLDASYSIVFGGLKRSEREALKGAGQR